MLHFAAESEARNLIEEVGNLSRISRRSNSQIRNLSRISRRSNSPWYDGGQQEEYQLQTNSKNDLEEEAITEPTTIPTKIDVESIMASTITSFDDEEPPLRLKVSQTPETLVQMMDDVESEEEEEDEEEVIGKNEG